MSLFQVLSQQSLLPPIEVGEAITSEDTDGRPQLYDGEAITMLVIAGYW
jgi:hypothetical protein